MKKYYLTTPIYYVNDVPHIGHAYTTIAADVLARWKRLRGQPAHFLTGLDEHGQKIQEAAAKASIDSQVYVDRISVEFKKLWSTLNISNDDFIRTTEPRHQTVVQEIFERLKSQGDIFKGTYEDWYCLNDESYFTESELVDKKCPDCGREVQKLKEESYFFKLSKYQSRLLDHYQQYPDFLSPRFRANEIINFVKSGLRDLSISRTRVKWGIPVSSDPSHVVYVWFDALINYISAIDYHAQQNRQSDMFLNTWPADVHIVGKEIFRFHAVIWPAMLMALGVPLPQKVFAHGWWTVEGTKMSKSLGNVVDPHKMAAIYGVDAFRYFLLRDVPFGGDGDFSEKSLLGRYNSELANNLGNLVQRTTTLLLKNLDGKIPNVPAQSQLLTDLSQQIKEIDLCYDRLAYGDVLEKLYSLMIRTNKFIDEKAPWTLGPDRKDELAPILVECLRVLKVLSVLYQPFMPIKSGEIWSRIGEEKSLEATGPGLLRDWEKGQVPQFAPHQSVKKGDPLFLRIAKK